MRRDHIDNVFNAMRSDTDDIVIVSNVRMISEGIDIPGIDCVVFLDEKQSKTEIV